MKETNTGDSQTIQWKDPKEEEERIKLKARLSKDTQDLRNVESFGSMAIPDNLTDIMIQEDKENANSSQSVGEPEPTRSK